MRPRNGFGTAGLVLGIIGVIFALIPFLYLIGLICALVALPLGVVGIVKANRRMATNLSATVTGTVLAAVALLLSIFWSVVWAETVDSAATGGREVPAAVDKTEETSKDGEKPAKKL